MMGVQSGWRTCGDRCLKSVRTPPRAAGGEKTWKKKVRDNYTVGFPDNFNFR